MLTSELDSIQNWWFTVLVGILLMTASFMSFWLGQRMQKQSTDKPYVSDLVPSNILGLLAIILGFSFSLVISRFEKRRDLAIAEANAILTAYERSQLLRTENPEPLKALYKNYVDARIISYDGLMNTDADLKDSRNLQKQIWKQLEIHVSKERGALESAYTFALGNMLDISHERNFALKKNLPVAIYFAMVIISLVAVGVVNYDRGRRLEDNHWRYILLACLLTMVISLIYDIDHPKSGLITISQDAMLELRKHL